MFYLLLLQSYLYLFKNFELKFNKYRLIDDQVIKQLLI